MEGGIHMARIPRMPKLPDPENIFSVIDKTGDAIDKGLDIIDKVVDKFERATEKFGPPEEIAPESHSITETYEIPSTPVLSGTACLPCCRDHFSTTSSSLAEGIRFAREKGVKDPEVVRRIRIALDELNVMERIDLAPTETARLSGVERELADWALKSSRDLRHAITAIKDVSTMEQATAKASEITEEFMGKLWSIPEEKCETCSEIREKLTELIEKRKSGGK